MIQGSFGGPLWSLEQRVMDRSSGIAERSFWRGILKWFLFSVT
jgi:hypothetical protein